MSVLQVEFGFTPNGLWNIMEFVIVAVFFAQFLYFLLKYKKEKKTGALASVCQFDLAYAIFFFATTINQVIYMGDSIPGLMPKLDYFISNGDMFVFLVSIEIKVSNQILLMIILLFWAIFPTMYPLEKYLKNKSKTIIFWMACVVTIMIMILYVVMFIIGRGIAQPDGFNGNSIAYSGEINTALGKVVNIIFIAISLITFIVALILILNFVLFYLILGIKTTGPLRVKALLIFFGFLLFYGALIIGNGFKSKFDEPGDVLGGWLALGGPIAFLIGNFILVLGFNKKVMD